ncbi:sigma-70 family RNA polymerase sigma factor, partial [Lactobacillus jensenii]|nr:sigma-70 family RNA polymerase sigma factor [Lactobacillus jensenii]
KEQRRAELFLPIENQDFELEEELSREDWLVLANELGQLTEIEMVIFREHFIEKCALKTLASNYNFSLRTLSRKKRELIIRMKAKLKRC